MHSMRNSYFLITLMPVSSAIITIVAISMKIP